MAKGTALFNRDGSVSGPPVGFNWRGIADVDYVSINYPAHALFTARYPELRKPGDARRIFDQMLGGGTDLADANAREWKDPDYWTEIYLRQAKQSLLQGDFGVFSPIRTDSQRPGSGSGDGFLIPEYLGDYPYGESESRFYPVNLSGDKRFSSLLSSLNTIPQTAGRGAFAGFRDSFVRTDKGDDVILPGWLGNGTIVTGEGNDIILSSPIVYAFSNYKFSIDNIYISPVARHYAYYPIPYALRGTAFNPKGNIIDAEDGADLIYYDGGTKEAKGGTGNDVLLPSFGSFNWGVDTLFQLGQPGKKGVMSYKEARTWKAEDQLLIAGSPDDLSLTVPYYGRQSLLSPVTVFGNPESVRPAALERWGAYVYDFFIKVGTFQYRDETVVPPILRAGPTTLKVLEQDLSPGANWGLSRGPGDAIKIDENVNVLGGQDLYGGPGDDLFYGIDPGFYKGFKTAGDGKGLRLAFNRGSQAEGRQHAQIIKPVEMFGGVGSDYFSLGNPINLKDADRVVGPGYIYRISGNSDQFLSRNSLAFGRDAAPDIFDFNLTYEGDNWETTVVTVPGTEGSTPTAQDYANTGSSALAAIAGLGGVVGRNMPIVNAIASVGSLLASVVGLFTPRPKDPISTTDAYFKDPLGNWRLKTNIQDWDPSDAIILRVDPSDPSSVRQRRWEQVEFGFKASSDTSGDGALDIVYTTAKDSAPTPIIRLEEFNANPRQGKGGWTVWNFNTGRREQIESSDLSFFGQVTPGRNDIPLNGYEDEYGFQVPGGERIFRWTEARLNKDTLSAMQSLSENIIVQLDTRKLGYYWDPKFIGDAAGGSSPQNPEITNLRIDEQASKLWIKEPVKSGEGLDSPFRWRSYSFLEIKNDSRAREIAQRATPLWQVPAPPRSAAANAGMTASRELQPLDPLTGMTSSEPLSGRTRTRPAVQPSDFAPNLAGRERAAAVATQRQDPLLAAQVPAGSGLDPLAELTNRKAWATLVDARRLPASDGSLQAAAIPVALPRWFQGLAADQSWDGVLPDGWQFSTADALA